MNRSLTIWLSVTTLAAVPARGQGTFQNFQNLDFESARVIFANGGMYTTNAFSGWSVFVGTNQVTFLPSLGNQPPIALLYGTNAAFIPSGNFAVMLEDGEFGAGYPSGPGSISQTGLVPAGSESLLFEMSTANEGTPLVFLGGQELSYTVVSRFPTYTLFGASIPTLAGQTATLTFSAGTTGPVGGILDDIQFSSQPIPEPSALSLIFAAGGVLASLGLRRRTPLVRSRPAGGCRT